MERKKKGVGGLNRRQFIKASLAAGGLSLMLNQKMPSAFASSQKKSLLYGGFSGDPGHLSPLIRHDTAIGIIIRNIFDNLVQPNFEKRTIMPELAMEWKNIDPLTWRFKMREGVRFHKKYGEMTAEDVVYTWRFHLDSKSFQVRTALWPLDTFKAVEKYVVEVKLKQPFGAFPGVVMGYCGMIVPKKAHQEMGNDTFKMNPVGTGPFEFVSLKGNEVVVKKFNDYWQKGLPYLEEIVFRSIPDSHIRLLALQKGELDFISHPDAKDVLEVKKAGQLVYYSTPGWNWDYQQFNLCHKGLLFHNKLVRQAISYALDRQAIKDEIYFGEASVTDNQIPFGFLGYRPGPLKYPARGDLKKAKELMSQAGCRGYDVEVICSDKDWLRRELELVAAMVSQIGINYKIRNLDMGSFNNLWLNDKYQQLLEDISVVAADPDATSWWFNHSKGSNASCYNNPKMDELLDKGRLEIDPKVREPIYHQIADVAMEDSRQIFHVNANYVRLHKKGIQGFQPGPQEFQESFHTVGWR